MVTIDINTDRVNNANVYIAWWRK